MNKSIRLALIPAFLLATAPALAYNQDSVFNGFYVGGSAGGAFVTAEPRIDVSDDYNNPIDQGGDFLTVLSAHDTVRGGVLKGALYTGYGLTWGALYVGLEAFINYENFSESDTITSNGRTTYDYISYNTTVSTKTTIDPFQFGADLRAGFLLTPTSLLYARAGYAYGKTKTSSETMFYGADPKLPESFNQTITQSTSKSNGIFRAGAGLEQHITNQWSVRTDYIYSYYGKLSTSGSAPIQTLPSGNTFVVTNTTTNKVMDNAVMLSVSYTFHC